MTSRISEYCFLFLFTLAVNSYPVAKQNGVECNITEDKIFKLKSIIQQVSAVQHIGNFSEDAVEKCAKLKNIIEALDQISQDVLSLKDQTGSDVAQSAVNNINKKLNEIVKSRDIFESSVQSEIAEKIDSFKDEITSLQQKIRETTENLHKVMAEDMFQNAQFNITEAVHDHTKWSDEAELPELLDQLEKSPKVHYAATQLLSNTGNEILLEKIYKTALERLQQLDVGKDDQKEKGKNILVNLMCFVYEAEPKLNECFSEYKSMFDSLGQKLFPGAWNTPSVKQDIKSRVLCDSQWPAEIIVGTG